MRKLTLLLLLLSGNILLLTAQDAPPPPGGAQKSLTPLSTSTTRAVVVGISDYQDDLIPDLRFAHRDAEAFAAWLQSPAADPCRKTKRFKALMLKHFPVYPPKE